MGSEDANSILAWLRSRSITVPTEWVEECVAFLESEVSHLCDFDHIPLLSNIYIVTHEESRDKVIIRI